MTATKTKTSKTPKDQETFALGLLSEDSMLDLESYGYCPVHVDFRLPQSSRESIKRLAMTLDSQEARLQDGTIVNSVPKAVAWLCEQFSESIK